MNYKLSPGGNEVHPGGRRPLGGEAGGGAVEAQVHFNPLLSLHEKVRRSEPRVRTTKLNNICHFFDFMSLFYTVVISYL